MQALSLESVAITDPVVSCGRNYQTIAMEQQSIAVLWTNDIMMASTAMVRGVRAANRKVSPGRRTALWELCVEKARLATIQATLSIFTGPITGWVISLASPETTRVRWLCGVSIESCW